MLQLTIHMHRQACRGHRQRAEGLAMQHWRPAVICSVALTGEETAHSAVWDDMHIKGPAHARILPIQG